MLKRISNFFSYKSQYGENRLVFLAARLKNTAKRDGYERDVAKANVSDPGEKLTFSDVLRISEDDMFSLVTDRDPNGDKALRHVKSIQHSRISHNLLATKTFCKAMAYRYRETADEKYLSLLLDGADYMISKKCKYGLYRYEQPLGLSQDEGPVTAGAIQVFCECYSFTKDKKYVEAACAAADAAKQHLYNEKYGYFHTKGCEDHTNTNINSSFAHAFAMLYSITRDEKWEKETEECIARVSGRQLDTGMFSYSDTNMTIFVSLYHYMIINALCQINNDCGIAVKGYKEIAEKAAAFGKTLIAENGMIKEPANDTGTSFFRTGTRAALMYLLLGDKETFCKIADSFGIFIKDGHVYSAFKAGKVMDGKYWYRRERHLSDAYCDIAQISLLLNGESFKEI